MLAGLIVFRAPGTSYHMRPPERGCGPAWSHRAGLWPVSRLTTAFHARGCPFSLSILTARDCPPGAGDGSLKVSARAPA
jgi:hypothetical protein